MRTRIFSLMAMITIMGAFNADAVAINFPRSESEIQVRARDLIVKEEKLYHCVLKGKTESKWSLVDSVELDVTADSLQSAAELALMPYLVAQEQPQQHPEVVKINVNNEHFFVREIHCKLVRRSL